MIIGSILDEILQSNLYTRRGPRRRKRSQRISSLIKSYRGIMRRDIQGIIPKRIKD
jgi:hypothetical protein